MAATADILDLLRALLHRSEVGVSAGSPEVIPVVIHDLDSCKELIDSAIRHAGGVFLDAGACSDGVEGTANPLLVSVVTRALRVPKAGSTWSSLSISQDGKFVRPAVDGATAASAPSRGIATVMGIGAAMFDRSLDGSPLAVIAYDETGLDEDWATAAWHLFTDQLMGVKVGRVRTLIVLAQTPNINYARHCSPAVSAAYRLSALGLESRKDRETNLAEIRRLCPRANELLVLFLGAGFSASSSLPLGDELRDKALRRQFNSSEPIRRVAERFYRYVSDNQRLLPSEEHLSADEFCRSLTLERVLREEFHRSGAPASPTLTDFAQDVAAAIKTPGPAVQYVGKLLQRKSNLVLVTVNFDVLIESVGDVEVFASDSDFSKCPTYLQAYRNDGGNVPLLKLHGSIMQRETIVATIDAYARGLAEPKAESLRELARPGDVTKWVYIGYSMRDPDVTALLSLREFGSRVDESWVSPFPIPTARRFSESSRDYGTGPTYWQRCITETADVFLKELNVAW